MKLWHFEPMYERKEVSTPEMEKPMNSPRLPPMDARSASNGMMIYSSLYVMSSGRSKSYPTIIVGAEEFLSRATSPAWP